MKKIKVLIFATAAIVAVAGANTEKTKSEWSYIVDQQGSDAYIYGFEEMIAQGVATELEVFEAIAYYNYLTPTGLDTFLKRGNIPSYIDDLIAVGRLPQGYTVSNGSSVSTVVTTPSSSVSSEEPFKETLTFDESKAGAYVVIDEDTKSYGTYYKENELRTWNLAEQVDVKGLMSNGYYKVVFEEKEQYINKSHLVTLEKYEAAWNETERIESKCEVAGSVTYTNALTKETKKEVLEALKHEYELKNEIASTCTSSGEKNYICYLCGKENKEIISATGHIHGTSHITKKETIFMTEATETRCVLCDEVVLTSNEHIKTEIIVLLSFLFTAGIGTVAFITIKKRKKNK